MTLSADDIKLALGHMQREMRRMFGYAPLPGLDFMDYEAQVNDLYECMKLLLASRDCLTDGEAEIPEELSANFDLTLRQAKKIHDTFNSFGKAS